MLVLGGRLSGGSGGRGLAESGARSPDDMRRVAEVAVAELEHAHAQLLGIIVNRADVERLDAITAAVQSVAPDALAASIPEDRYLIAPTVTSVMEACDARFVRGDEQLHGPRGARGRRRRHEMENVLPRLTEGAVVLIPGDRSEVLLAVLMAHASETFPSIAAIILYGGFETPASVQTLVEGLDPALPILRTDYGTYDTVLRITETRARLAADSQRKYDTALALFERHVDAPALLQRLDVTRSETITPLMFEYGLLERARGDRKHIVLPEGDDDRILRAASTLLQRRVCDLTILGDEGRGARPRGRARPRSRRGADRQPVRRAAAPALRRGVRAAAGPQGRRRSRSARDIVTDVSYFGTMMVHLGLADGMVSGAAHTTAHTIRPSFEIIKTDPGVGVVSSVFLMALADRVLVYGDCAVIPDPTAEQLADIAISSAATAQQFAIEPRIAMLSYSTGESGSGDDVEKVRAATAARARAPPRSARRGADPVRRRRRPRRRADEDARLAGRRPGDGLRLPRPEHGQQHLQGGAALGGRRRDRPGAAGPAQAGQRPQPRSPRERHRQHRRDHRHPGAAHPAAADDPHLDDRRHGMSGIPGTRVFVVNSGSSSIKYQLVDVETEQAILSGLVERIGEPGGDAVDHVDGMRRVLAELGDAATSLVAVGHRVVHGGSRVHRADRGHRGGRSRSIEEVSTLAPLHNPANLAGIRAAMAVLPGVPHVAVFDTAFHQTHAARGLHLRDRPRASPAPTACAATDSTARPTSSSPSAPPRTSGGRSSSSS